MIRSIQYPQHAMPIHGLFMAGLAGSGIASLIVGRSAYEAACRQYPNARLTLRHGIRVIEETE